MGRKFSPPPARLARRPWSSFPALPARPLTRSTPRRVLLGPAQVRLEGPPSVWGTLPTPVFKRSLGHPAKWGCGRCAKLIFNSLAGVGDGERGREACLAPGGKCARRGRGGELRASLSLIENRNMLKVFLLFWIGGWEICHSASTFILPFRLSLCSDPCPHV